MPEHTRKKRPRDPALLARQVVEEAICEPLTENPEIPAEEDARNPHAVALGKLGGKKGGKARAEKLTPEQRQEIARIAGRARWKKTEKKD